jgi:hypothetical protein
LRDYPFYKDKIGEVIGKLRIECQKDEKKQDKKEIYELYKDLEACCQYGYLYDAQFKDYYKQYTEYIKEVALKRVTDDKNRAKIWRELYWEVVKLESFPFFESFLIFMEHKRPYEKRFYEPRAKTLKIVVDDLQRLEDSKTQKMLTESLPARTGKSTIMVFFGSWICLRKPESHNAMGTHSGFLADHFYKEMLDLLTSEEYCFQELYAYFQPGKKFIEDKSAEKMTISLATKSDFPTFTFRGIDGTWTGAVDISGGDIKTSGYLFVDDLVRDRTHSLSPKRMNDTFSEYLNKMVDRKNDGAKEIMIGTLWNVLDPIKRLEEMYGNDDRYVFRRIPALNENGESNFNYEVKGFSTEYYQDMKDKLIKAGNEAEWMAKFQQQPFVREGILLPLDQLGYFNGVLPVEHKYRFVVNCDVAFGGGDSVSMPITLYDKTDDLVYVVDWYFNSSGVMITVPGVVDMIIKHGIKKVTFEANAGGNLYASKVQEELKKRNYLCACDSVRAPNNASKEDKIKACEGVIRQKYRFLDGTKHTPEEYSEETIIYERSPEYERALEEMGTYVTIGKNLHDDAIDSISQNAEQTFDTMQRRTVIMDCPF